MTIPASSGRRRNLPVASAALLAAGLLQIQTPALGAWSYPGCADVTDEDFRRVRLVQRGGVGDPSLDEPLKMAFDAVKGPDGRTYADIYFVERKGKLKRYDALKKTVALLGQIDTYAGEDQGLNGIALDPDFKKNRWIYLFYSPKQPAVFRVARFTLGPDGLLPGSERPLLDMPNAERRAGVWHAAGAMAFDAYGDLWVTVGKNSTDDPNTVSETVKYSSTEWGASCTADLRGGVLRIHPDPAAPKGYTIPKGNFGAFFSEKYGKAGDAARAALFADTARVRPEIFVKGVRNPYTLTLDPVRRWATWGCVGPNRRQVHEEFNLAREPGFYGFPYFAGKNLVLQPGKDPQKPLNNSHWCRELGGVQELPPAVPALYAYSQRAAMTGPIYRYQPTLVSDIKLPPHFHRLWLVADFNIPSWFKTLTLDSAGTAVLAEQDIFRTLGLTRPLDFQQGPDGALYVTNYSGYFNSNDQTSIDRIEYTGPPCAARPDLVVEKAGCRDPGFLEFDPGATHAWPEACRTPKGSGVARPLTASGVDWSVSRGRLSVRGPDPFSVRILAVDGRVLAAYPRQREGEWPLPESLAAGLHVLEIRTANGVFRGSLVLPVRP